MKINITFRHLESTPAIKQHVEEKMEKIKKYFLGPVAIHVILSVEKKIRHQCEITLTEDHFKATAVEECENLYASIDTAIHKLERQLKKHKEQVKDHKHHNA